MRRFTLILLIGSSMLFCGTALGASILAAGTAAAPFALTDVAGAAAGVFSLEQLFTLSGPAELTTLKINAASFSAQTLEVQLFSGLGLEGTGTLLKTFNFSVAGGFSGSALAIPTITQATAVSLNAGTYSLLLTDPGSSSDVIYLNTATAANTPDGSLGGTNSSYGADGQQNIVFELDGSLGSAAPEPQSAPFLATALILGMGWLIRKNPKRAV